MKLLRKFDKHNIEQDFKGDKIDIPQTVLYRRDVWSAAIFDNIKGTPYDAILYYERVRPENYDRFCVNEILGPLEPKEIKCNCGLKFTSMAGTDAHSEWCDTLQKDPWDITD